MATTIYVCEWSTGEYSDRTDIAMCAFTSEKDASEFTDQANNLLKERGLFMDDVTGDAHGEPIELDGTRYYVSYTGARVSYYPIELR
jgi:hypothetical protein